MKKHAKLLIFTVLSITYLLAIYIFHENKLSVFLLTSAYAFSYLIYGLYHHIEQKDLNLKIFLEYVLIGFTTLFLLKVLILP